MLDIERESSYPTPLANSSLLTSMLLSLMVQKHAPTTLQTPDTIFHEYDFIIVGAGSAGSTLAGRLSEKPCVSVLLLEAGKSPPLLTEVPAYGTSFFGSDLDYAIKTVPQKHTARLQKDRKIAMHAGKSLGGSSAINEMYYVRGNHKNYDDWAAQGAVGWSFKDVLPYFKKLEDNKDPEFVKNGYHGVGGPVTVERPAYESQLSNAVYKAAETLGYGIVDSNGPNQTGFYLYQLTTRDHQRCSTAKAYLVPAENRTNLHILPEALVHKVLIENKRAVGVTFEVKGKLYEVKSKKEVILSAGTIHSPQLLMLSGIGPKKELEKHKIHVVEDLPVGKNLQDHFATNPSFDLDPSLTPVLQREKNNESVNEYINHRTGILTSGISGMAFLNTDKNLNYDFPDVEYYFIEYDAHIFKSLQITDETYNQVYKPRENKPFYSCGVRIIQPKSRGYIALKSSNPHDPPIIDPNYLSHPEDLRRIVEGMKICMKIGTSGPMQQIGSKPFNTTFPGCEKYLKFGLFSDPNLICQAQSIALSASHLVGTVKMGNPIDITTVVDPELRVKNIKGLRVVDASIMPIIPSGNTNTPTIMVAEKAADIIKTTFEC